MNSFMKYILASFASLPLLSAAQQIQRYELIGTIHQLADRKHNKAVLMRLLPGRTVFDTTEVINGVFTFTGATQEAQLAYVYITHDGTMPPSISLGDHLAVYLETGSIRIVGDDSLKNAKVSGTSLNDDQQELVELMQPLDNQLSLLQQQYAGASQSEDSS